MNETTTVDPDVKLRRVVKRALKGYGAKPALVYCILSQDEWKHFEAQKEKYRGMASGEEDDLEKDVHEFVISSYVECHDGPHTRSCPDRPTTT